MIVPDINLLVYAHNVESRFHEPALQWWRGCLAGRAAVGILPAVAFGFIRIVTHPRISDSPVPVTVAVRSVRAWLVAAPVIVLRPSTAHIERALDWLELLGVAGSLTTDAHIAAAAMEHDAEVHTADVDFQRFPGLRCHYPLRQG